MTEFPEAASIADEMKADLQPIPPQEKLKVVADVVAGQTVRATRHRQSGGPVSGTNGPRKEPFAISSDGHFAEAAICTARAKLEGVRELRSRPRPRDIDVNDGAHAEGRRRGH